MKRIALCVGVSCVGLLLLNLMAQEYAYLTMPPRAAVEPFLRLSVMAFLLGGLIEWKRIIILLQGHFRLNWLLLVAAIILLALATVPPWIYARTLIATPIPGIEPLRWLFMPLQLGVMSSTILNLIAGILLVRSVSNQLDQDTD